tara:strand:+ start:684 stop:1697 length:1014 start_codon:yes stop_codon:yes gene_type:complete
MKQDYWTYNKPLSMTGFGGGVASLPAVSGGGLDDSAYSGFFTSGASPINVSSSSRDDFSGGYGSNTGTHDFSDAFFDHANQKIWGDSGFNQGEGYYGWNNGGSTYSGNANFYTVNTSKSSLGSGGGSRMGGCTVAYLGDNTPVLVLGDISGSYIRFYFWNYPTTASVANTYIGYLNVTTGTTNQPNYISCSGLCYSGTHLIMGTQTGNYPSNTLDRYLWGYDLPADTTAINSSSTISAVLRWTTPHALQNGLVWGGGNRVYLTSYDSGLGGSYGNGQYGGVTQIILTDNGFSGTHSVVGSVGQYNQSGSTFGLGMDYKNRKLILGGHNIGTYGVYGE